jgi:hypothetical protein
MLLLSDDMGIIMRTMKKTISKSWQSEYFDWPTSEDEDECLLRNNEMGIISLLRDENRDNLNLLKNEDKEDMINRPMFSDSINSPENWICNAETTHSDKGSEVYGDSGDTPTIYLDCTCADCLMKENKMLILGDPVGTASWTSDYLKELGYVGLYSR